MRINIFLKSNIDKKARKDMFLNIVSNLLSGDYNIKIIQSPSDAMILTNKSFYNLLEPTEYSRGHRCEIAYHEPNLNRDELTIVQKSITGNIDDNIFVIKEEWM